MGENSKIEWTDHTFNPWIGCTKISAGCANCYALDLMETRYKRVKWGPQGTRKRTSEVNWRKPLAWNRQAERDGVRRKVFCASLADVFEDREELAPWRADLFRLIEQTRQLDWLLLTKRPENVNQMIGRATGRSASAWLADCHHIWLGTSVEDQQRADERIPRLMQIPARMRFLSCEPLLGPVDLLSWLPIEYDVDSDYQIVESTMRHSSIRAARFREWGYSIDWVIVGGESGHGARPMHPVWVRSLRDQCQAAGVPYFFKQWGEFAPHYEAVDIEERKIVMRDFPLGTFRKVGKRVAGRLLDGREWNEFPVTEPA